MTSDLFLSDRLGDVLRTWLEGRSPGTVRAYSAEIARYALHRGLPGPREAVEELLSKGPGPANMLVRSWRGKMLDAKLSGNTINMRLAVLRSIVSIARQAGMIEWALDVPGVKVRLTTDVRGPTWRKLAEMIEHEPSLRNKALLALLGHRGLRCAEALGITAMDVAPGGASVTITGKGRREPETLWLAPAAAALLAEWMAVADFEEPTDRVFPICPSVARVMVKNAGARVGVDVHPHALRHTAVTRALTVMRGDVRAVSKFSRHSDIRTVCDYDDARQETATRVAYAVGGSEFPEVEE